MVEVRLSAFEGPLDLLLHLITKAKIDIKDVFVSQITEQYLSSMEDLSQLDMDVASEFLQMAATLLEIKSRSLLPRPPRDDGEEDPREVLLRRLEEYKQIKEAGKQLRTREEDALAMLQRLPEELVARQKIELEQLSLSALQEAFLRLMQKPRSVEIPAAPQRSIYREQWTIARCSADILARLRVAERITFEALFEDDLPDREKLVSTFIAMLELLKAGRICVHQEQLYGEIYLSACDPSRAVELTDTDKERDDAIGE